MPYRSSLGRFSKQSWDEFNHEIKQAENEHLMEGIIAGCALVAYADFSVAAFGGSPRYRTWGLLCPDGLSSKQHLSKLAHAQQPLRRA